MVMVLSAKRIFHECQLMYYALERLDEAEQST